VKGGRCVCGGRFKCLSTDTQGQSPSPDSGLIRRHFCARKRRVRQNVKYKYFASAADRLITPVSENLAPNLEVACSVKETRNGRVTKV